MNGEIKKKKLLYILVIVVGISFILGTLFISILSKDNQLLVKDSVTKYFNSLKVDSINYSSLFIEDLFKRNICSITIWIFGISLIGVLLVVGFLILYSFIVGFSFTSIIYTFGFKGIFTSIIYLIPLLLTLFIYFLVSYYSISFSILLFNNLFRRKEFNKIVIIKRYIKLLLLSILILFIITLISTFIIPNILRVL